MKRLILNTKAALLRSRYVVVAVILMAAILTFGLTRVILSVMSADTADMDVLDMIRISGVGFLYDLSFLVYALVPINLYLLLMPNRIWSSTVHRWLVHLFCFAAIYGLLFIIVAEILFWLEFQVRFNFISVDYLVYRREVTNNILESYPVAIIFSAIFVLCLAIYWKFAAYVERALAQNESFKRRFVVAFSLMLLPFATYAVIDSDLRDLSTNSYQKELSSNGPYQFFSAFRHNELDYSTFYTSLENGLASTTLHNEVREKNCTFTGHGLFNIRRQVNNDALPEKRLNVMLVMIESMSADYLGVFGNDKNLTPQLDSVAEKSLSFTRFYATGTRTTRGLEAVTLSIPPTPGRSIVKRLGHESNMWSLGNVLKTKGYDVSFHYGGRGYFDNMNAFFSGNGYRIVDQSSVPESDIGFANAWGMADEYIYDAALKSADNAYTEGQPFFYHIMTTSNHRPYTYPDGRIDIASGSGRNGAIKYTDWAIGDFLEKAREKPWFDDTVFVFMADHTAGSAGKLALPVFRYHIPFFIYSPKHVKPAQMDKIASQIDFAPTILALLNMNYESNFFGKNIFTMKPDEERALIGNYQNLGLYTQGLLSVISPKHRLTQQINPENKDPLVKEVGIDDPHMRRNLAYYQGASYIYSHHMNAWTDERVGQLTTQLNIDP